MSYGFGPFDPWDDDDDYNPYYDGPPNYPFFRRHLRPWFMPFALFNYGGLWNLGGGINMNWRDDAEQMVMTNLTRGHAWMDPRQRSALVQQIVDQTSRLAMSGGVDQAMRNAIADEFAAKKQEWVQQGQNPMEVERMEQGLRRGQNDQTVALFHTYNQWDEKHQSQGQQGRQQLTSSSNANSTTTNQETHNTYNLIQSPNQPQQQQQQLPAPPQQQYLPAPQQQRQLNQQPQQIQYQQQTPMPQQQYQAQPQPQYQQQQIPQPQPQPMLSPMPQQADMQAGQNAFTQFQQTMTTVTSSMQGLNAADTPQLAFPGTQNMHGTSVPLQQQMQGQAQPLQIAYQQDPNAVATFQQAAQQVQQPAPQLMPANTGQIDAYYPAQQTETRRDREKKKKKQSKS